MSSEATQEAKVSELLQIAALLFPGFLTLRVADYFAFSPKQEGVELIASAFAATLLDVGIALVIVRLLFVVRRKKGLVPGGFAITPRFIVLLAIVAIVTGGFWAFVESHGLLYRLRLSERASRSEVWDTAFARNSRKPSPSYVRVVTVRGEVYHGIPSLYSEGSEERALFLEDARREVKVAHPHPEPGHGPEEWQPVECVPVGSDVTSGSVLLLKDQVRLVEFRAATRRVAIPGKGGALAYDCAAWVPRIAGDASTETESGETAHKQKVPKQ